jgi:hypothetical protein
MKIMGKDKTGILGRMSDGFGVAINRVSTYDTTENDRTHDDFRGEGLNVLVGLRMKCLISWIVSSTKVSAVEFMGKSHP